MAYFRDTQHLYEVMDALVERLSREEAIAQELGRANLIVRFNCRQPSGIITVDLTRRPFGFQTGEGPLRCDAEISLPADVAHEFWLGRVNVPRAVATRTIVVRGNVPKVLGLLPAMKPAYDIYPQVLCELGYAEMLPKVEKRVTRRAPGLWGRLTGPKRKPVEIDYAALNRHLIPLVEEEEVEAKPIKFLKQQLPVEENALKVEMLRRMQLIRACEEMLAEEFRKGTLPSEDLYLSTGQEATAVGACFALRYDDYLVTSYRGLGHMLAKGSDMKALVAEIYGKSTGLCNGKGGCKHVADAKIGALGATGIVAAPGLLALGAAHSAKLRGTDQVTMVFMGDGATNHGMFHEALNFAATFDLPVIFVIENNLYGEFTPLAKVTKVQRLSDKGAAHGVPGVTVDGNDVWAVHTAVREAVARARSGNGPTLVEAMTYRWRPHTEGETAAYRSAEEIEAWKQRDPIARWRRTLIEAGLVTNAEWESMVQESRAMAQAALAFAQSSPEPTPESLTTDVFAPEPARLYRPMPLVEGRREVAYSQALNEAMAEELARDERVYIIGEDITTGGYFDITVGLAPRFGEKRVIDAPISESAIVGSAVGAAMTGMRPIVEILFSDFLTCCLDPLVNHAAKLRYTSGGQFTLPMVLRSAGGAGLGLAAQHSQSFEGLLAGIPGLIIVAPSTPYDAKGLLKSAVRSNNVVLFFENKLLYATTGPIHDGEYLVPIGVADVKCEGRDATVVAIGAMVPAALEAAGMLANEGIEVEVIDPRTLVPLDLATIVRSVVKTGRLVVVEEAHFGGGFGGQIAARVADAAFRALRAPIKRLAGLDVPIPYNRALETASIPSAEQIVEAVRKIVE
jgi:2-oxoisovalerate dehydrogenase E1 component